MTQVDDYGNPIEPQTIADKLVVWGESVKHSVEDWIGITKVHNEKTKQEIEANWASKTSNSYLQHLPTKERLEALNASPEYSYDYDMAMNNGINASQILDHLEKKPTIYKISEARKAGIADDEIVKHLKKKGEDIRASLFNKKLGVFSTSDVAKGFVRGLAKIGAVEHDVANYIGVEANETNTKYIKQLHQLSDAIKDSMDDPNSIGAFLGEMTAGAPFTPFQEAKLGLYGVALFSGISGANYAYGESRLEGETKDKALKKGAVGGAVGAVGGAVLGQTIRGAGYVANEIAGRLSDKAKDRALNMLEREFRLEKKDIETATRDYLKINESTGDNKTDAIVAVVNKYGKTEGKEVMKTILRKNPELLIKAREQRADRLNLVNEYANKEGYLHIQETLNHIIGFANKAKKDYADFVTDIARTKVYQTPIRMDLPELGAERFSQPELANLYSDIRSMFREGTDLATMLEQYKNINRLARSVSKSAKGKKHELYQLKARVDDMIEQTLSPDDYAIFKVVNKQYGTMANLLENNAFGRLAEQASKGREIGKGNTNTKVSHTNLINNLLNAQVGEGTFKELGEIVSPKVLKGIEVGYIKETLQAMGKGNVENATLENLARNMQKKGFTTKEGKELHNLILYIKDRFQLDDLVKNMAVTHPEFGTNLDVGNRSANVVSKLASEMLSKLFSQSAKMIAGINPPNLPIVKEIKETGNRILSYEAVEKALQKEGGVKEITKMLDDNIPNALIPNIIKPIISGGGLKTFEPQVTKETYESYQLPYMNSMQVYHQSLMDLAQSVPFSNSDIKKLLNLRDKQVNSVKKLTEIIAKSNLDIVESGNIRPDVIAKSLHENGMSILFEGTSKLVKEVKTPEIIYHNSSSKFERSKLKFGETTKFLGKGTYFSVSKNPKLNSHSYTLPQGTKVLELNNKEEYEYLLKSLGVNRDNLNAELRKNLNVDVLKVNYKGNTYFNVLDKKLHDKIVRGE